MTQTAPQTVPAFALATEQKKRVFSRLAIYRNLAAGVGFGADLEAAIAQGETKLETAFALFVACDTPEKLDLDDFYDATFDVLETVSRAYADLLKGRNLAGEAAERLTVAKGYLVPKNQALPTFLEARETALSISNGRDLKSWLALDGIAALLHQAPAKDKKAPLQIRLFASAMFQQWHGTADVEKLAGELQTLDFDSVMLFYSCLSWALESPGMRVSTSLDALIAAIGQDENARQGERDALRLKVWRNLLVFDSLDVFGTRPGVWREPAASGEKREKMDGEKLFSSDALLRILGHRVTASQVPKDVVLVVGEWAAKFQGNREILSDFGNLRLIAGIPARRAAGAWARCVGLVLLQKWREKSTKATPITHKTDAGEVRSETLRFPTVTRRELLLSTLRPNHDVSAILSGNDPQRAKAYWSVAIELLQKENLVGYYKELGILPENGWKDAWLDQPLDIRPKGETLRDAKEIHAAGAKARKRTSRKK